VTERKDGQYEKALASALAATKANSDSANAWWQVALSRRMLGDPRNAIPALERTVKLSPALAGSNSEMSRRGFALSQTRGQPGTCRGSAHSRIYGWLAERHATGRRTPRNRAAIRSRRLMGSC
jgi:tetratricopeptide (TPR) repeat protein